MKKVYESKVHESKVKISLLLDFELLNSSTPLKELVGGYWSGRCDDSLHLLPIANK